jgi:hypothetical protein
MIVGISIRYKMKVIFRSSVFYQVGGSTKLK